jgi:tRNA nucleotidyltransferase (CCA-adding enzyme)
MPASIDDLCVVMRADHDGRPPRHSAETLAQIDTLRSRAHALALANTFPRPLLLGRHLISLGLKPSPRFKTILDLAFEAQLDGAFADESGALAWLKNYLQLHPINLG